MKRRVIFFVALLLACMLSSCTGETQEPPRMTLGNVSTENEETVSATETATETEAETEAETDAVTGAEGVLLRIEAPSPVFDYETAVLSWESVKNAVGYVVTVNGTEMAMQTETQCAFAADGTYTVQVRAIAGEGYRNSRLSEQVVFTIGWANVPLA